MALAKENDLDFTIENAKEIRYCNHKANYK